MLTKPISYVDYDGNERSENFYFNLSKAELMEMQLSEAGGLEKMIRSIIDAQDTPKIFALFKKMILAAYGEKSADGKHFRKSEEISTDFMNTEAYTVLLMELASDPEAAAKFITEIIPPDMREPVETEIMKIPAK